MSKTDEERRDLWNDFAKSRATKTKPLHPKEPKCPPKPTDPPSPTGPEAA